MIFVMPPAGLDIIAMRDSLRMGKILWQKHALQRLLERSISRVEVTQVLAKGERIENYPQDTPWPSALFLGWTGERPLHVVAAHDPANEIVAIITAYDPSEEYFEVDWKTRKQR